MVEVKCGNLLSFSNFCFALIFVGTLAAGTIQFLKTFTYNMDDHPDNEESKGNKISLGFGIVMIVYAIFCVFMICLSLVKTLIWVEFIGSFILGTVCIILSILVLIDVSPTLEAAWGCGLGAGGLGLIQAAVTVFRIQRRKKKNYDEKWSRTNLREGPTEYEKSYFN